LIKSCKIRTITYRKILFAIITIFLGVIINKEVVKAAESEMGDSINYSDIQDVIDDILQEDSSMDFEDYVNRLVSGEEAFSFSDIADKLKTTVMDEVSANLDTFGQLISIALIAAVFTNLSLALKNNQVSETGYYVTYLLLFGILTSSFVAASAIAASAIGSILDFMKALIPAYFLSVGFTTGAGTSLVYYEAALMIITVADFLLIKVVIPMINIYLMIMLVNNLSKEDMLSKLAGLLSSIIEWSMKSLLAAVVGFHTIQGLIVPVADKVKRSALLKASESIPGIGNAIEGVTETVLGAGVLLKNAIGVAGLVIIVAICAVPLIKLLIITLIYKFGCASLQPISDKRIIECIGASAKSAAMLLEAVFIGAVLFMLTITLVAVTTGGLV
jgi:stage III sporulation protein AE